MRRLYLRNDWIGYPMRKDNDPEKDNPLCMTNEETFDTTQEIELNPDGTIKNKETKLFGEEESGCPFSEHPDIFLFCPVRAYSNRPVSSSLVCQRGNDILPRCANLAPAGTGKQPPYLRALSSIIREP